MYNYVLISYIIVIILSILYIITCNILQRIIIIITLCKFELIYCITVLKDGEEKSL